jgi:hypothetical protein
MLAISYQLSGIGGGEQAIPASTALSRDLDGKVASRLRQHSTEAVHWEELVLLVNSTP